MAENVVSILIQELVSLLVEQVDLLSAGVGQEVAQIKDNFESIRALLKDADKRQHREEGVKKWVKQVRDVAYDTATTLGEFLYRVGPPSAPGLAGFLLRFTRLFRHFLARYWFAAELQTIRTRLQAITEKANEFSFTPSATEVATAGPHEFRLTESVRVQEPEIVGIDKPKKDLLKILLSKEPRTVVVSVVGVGGLGKTTLVWQVYQDDAVRKQFACHAWVKVSQPFSFEELLKAMMTEFIQSGEGSSPADVSSMNYVQLVNALRNHLQKLRYLLVLDDVWRIDAWEDLKSALPENKLKSRIIITTRIHHVASYCSTSPATIYKMEPLSPVEALTIFCKKAFMNDSCPLELEEVSQRILKICGGLPFAILAMGGVLLTKNKALVEFETVYQKLSTELVNSDILTTMNKILQFNYDDLPWNLKCCFLYFGIYPKECAIKRGQLIREWIAEGFVKPAYGVPLEHVAESYLNELVHRGLIEVARLNSYGRLYECRVHANDLVLEFIYQKSEEQNFVTLTRGEMGSQDRVHRLSSQKTLSTLENTSAISHLHSLFVFGTMEIPELSRFHTLKVLNLSGINLTKFPNAIVNLFHLKYLNLRNTGIREVPRSIGNLRNLQTLDLKYTYVVELPSGILHLQHLRMVLKYSFYYDNLVSRVQGIKMPESLGYLRSLYKLGTVQLDGGRLQAEELGRLSQLRTLGIVTRKGQDWDILCSSIQNMRHLETLWINTNEEDKPLDVRFISSLSPKLRSICLRGSLLLLPEMIGSFANLIKIALVSSRLSNDPLKALEHLPNLAYLSLEDAHDGEEMSCGHGGFQKLKSLYISVLRSLRIMRIEKGAMPRLEIIQIRDCPKLDTVPFGMEYLTTLKELSLYRMSVDLLHKIIRDSGQDWDKVKHIDFIKCNGRLL